MEKNNDRTVSLTRELDDLLEDLRAERSNFTTEATLRKAKSAALIESEKQVIKLRQQPKTDCGRWGNLQEQLNEAKASLKQYQKTDPSKEWRDHIQQLEASWLQEKQNQKK